MISKSVAIFFFAKCKLNYCTTISIWIYECIFVYPTLFAYIQMFISMQKSSSKIAIMWHEYVKMFWAVAAADLLKRGSSHALTCPLLFSCLLYALSKFDRSPNPNFDQTTHPWDGFIKRHGQQYIFFFTALPVSQLTLSYQESWKDLLLLPIFCTKSILGVDLPCCLILSFSS